MFDSHEIWIALRKLEEKIEHLEKIMADTSKLTAAVGKLSTDVDALIASESGTQPAIDAATSAVEAVDAKVTAATPAPPTP